ncbi:MAG: RNA methyltransferase [Oscillospiraceae bacterium]|nr:RNA methyltransferase [Oscillospiraceae bacterium]
MELLKSRSNDKIKLAVSLRESAAKRRGLDLFFLEGVRLCADAAESGTKIAASFFTGKAMDKNPAQVTEIAGKSDSSYLITEELSRFLSDTVMPQGVFCLCKTLDKVKSCNKIDSGGKYLALEKIQNPDNLGAVCRAAEAMGLTGLIVSAGCDVYNPKAQRAAMGSLLRMPIIETDDLGALLAKAAADGMLTLASTSDRVAERITDVPMDGGVICVLGNEGAGVTKETAELCRRSVTIPMRGRAESLNVAAAAAIISWEMTRGN